MTIIFRFIDGYSLHPKGVLSTPKEHRTLSIGSLIAPMDLILSFPWVHSLVTSKNLAKGYGLSISEVMA